MKKPENSSIHRRGRHAVRFKWSTVYTLGGRRLEIVFTASQKPEVARLQDEIERLMGVKSYLGDSVFERSEW